MATFLLHKDTTLHVTRIRYSYIFAKTLYCLPMSLKRTPGLLSWQNLKCHRVLISTKHIRRNKAICRTFRAVCEQAYDVSSGFLRDPIHATYNTKVCFLLQHYCTVSYTSRMPS